jgi:predicted N-acyltransferase
MDAIVGGENKSSLFNKKSREFSALSAVKVFPKLHRSVPYTPRSGENFFARKIKKIHSEIFY